MLSHNSKGFIAVFEGPSKAIQCGQDLLSSMATSLTQISCAVHIKEAMLEEILEPGNKIKTTLEAILAQSAAQQILTTLTVKHLLSGSGLCFQAHRSIEVTILESFAQLFRVIDPSIQTLPAPHIKARQALKHESFLENVLQCIETHLSDELFGVEMLCKEIGVSERQLQRKLKAITNKSPIKLICSVRLHRAKELILKQQYNIAEISYMTGFLSPSYFSKCFKKEFGLSPSSLLKKEESPLLSETL